MKKPIRNKLCAAALGTMTAFSMLAPDQATAGEPFIGELKLVGYTFCPRGWTDAAGQLLPINQNDALFSLYGTTFGGDGRTTFGLPDLRGRFVLGQGSGPGLTPRTMGQKGGQENKTLTTQEMPSHTHQAYGSGLPANRTGTENKLLAKHPQGQHHYTEVLTDNRPMSAQMIGHMGGGQNFQIMNPYLVMRWCVALVGTYPSRN